jgi:methionyl-tRNA synthetase
MSEKFYLTTTLPYVNSDPHLGHALEFVQADAIARFHRLMGDDVFLNTGTDEHGSKILEKARASRRPTQEYVDEYAGRFEDFLKKINVKYDAFIRTTDVKHKAAAQEFWKKCAQNGDIEKRLYKTRYCMGCELEKTDSELEEGRCPLHPNLEIEEREEENYFFKFSRYQEKLLKLYESNPDFVIPAHRLNEIKSFVSGGLQDFSISRLKEKMPWGVAVPGDEEHVMYVWFDALVNYISTLGWPEGSNFKNYWPGFQIAGKDNLRQQSAMWQAMLMSAGLPASRQIFIHGFITSGGAKMSKTVGNVVDPVEIVNKYGPEALRYWLVREVPSSEDGDFTWEKFHNAYTANLSNGLGNLASRVLKMAENQGVKLPAANDISTISKKDLFPGEYVKAMNAFDMKAAADCVWAMISSCDEYIQKEEPFRKVKTDPEGAAKDIVFLLGKLLKIAISVEPFLPDTSSRILRHLEKGESMAVPLFPRVEVS